MSVNFSLPKKVLVIHGVQGGSDSDQNQNQVIEENLSQHLSSVNYNTSMFTYEDINDQAQQTTKRIFSALAGNPIGALVAASAVDIAGDVIIALQEGDVYDEIINKLCDKIMASFTLGEPLYIVSHSLGTIYAFDAVNKLMQENDLFLYNQKETWPIQGLVTLGSPIALSMFTRDWHKITSLLPAGQEVDDENTQLFAWQNYWDPTDPVVSGSVLGLPWSEEAFKERFDDNKTYPLGWDIKPRSVITGKAHLLAHIAYWEDSFVGAGIAQMLLR